MSLRHLLGPETNSSFFFIIDSYATTNALKFSLKIYYLELFKLILKIRTTFIVYGHQENFVKSLEENSFIR